MRFWEALTLACVFGCGPLITTPSEGETEGTSAGGEGPMTGVPDTTTGATTGFTTTGPSTSPPTTTVPPPTTVGTTTDPDSSGDDVITECGFICDFDVPEAIECSIWDQDCPKGEKCMPWANDGGNSWNATKCTPLADDPGAPGDPCSVEGSGVSGIDDCDIASMCFYVDPKTNEGTCIAFCVGSENNPFCTEECAECSLSGDGVLTLCLPTCDPIAQDCGEGQACYASSEGFTCAPDASGRSGAPGDPCEFLNVCDQGTMCASQDAIPGCEGTGCCTPFCIVGDDTPCAAIPGTVCGPLFEDPPPGECFPTNVGVCVSP